MSETAELIRSARLARKWSLRQLGDAVGVTPAYIADIEAGRRQPSAELQDRLSTTLEIPAEELVAADSRLTKDLRDWIEERPQLTSLLRALRSTPNSDTLVQRLGRLVGRRAPPPAQAAAGLLVIWESELRAMAQEASAWSIETGGDLFGRWHDLPTVLFASKAGPAAQRGQAHFRLDINYLRQLSETLATDWALRYFGDWHSHHRLGLSAPSNGDRSRIRSIAGRNQFTNMAEIIVTLDDGQREPTVRVHPWLYDLSSRDASPLPLRVKVLPGISPVRQALIACNALPEQDLRGWERMPLDRIRIGSDTTSPALEAASDVDSITRERVLAQLAGALEEASGAPIERHSTGFGLILVARLVEPDYLAFALGASWPMPVLDVHRMNRADGSTAPVKSPDKLAALDMGRIVDVYRNMRARPSGAKHVDA